MDVAHLWLLFGVFGVVLVVAPNREVQAWRILRGFGKGARMEFVRRSDGRLTSGAESERLLTRLIMRNARATGCFLGLLGFGQFLLLTGPRLSTSGLQSAVVATCVCSAILGPYLVLRVFLEPCGNGGEGPERRAATVEDYVGPLRRVLTWFAAVSALAVPVFAATMGAGDTYDGSRLFWEGLIGIPLVSFAVLVAVEVESRGMRDGQADPALTYVWDALRARAIRAVTAFAVAGTGLAWGILSDALTGVALVESPLPDWVAAAHAGTRAAAAGLLFSAVLVLLVPSGFRKRLWPWLGRDELMRWGPPGS